MSMEWDDNERGCFSALGLGMGKSAWCKQMGYSIS